MLAQRTQNRRRVGVGWRCDEAGITGSAEWWVSAVVAVPRMMSCPAFGATRVWHHLVMESLPDPPVSAGFHHSAPTYVGAENTRAAPSGPALQGAPQAAPAGPSGGPPPSWLRPGQGATPHLAPPRHQVAARPSTQRRSSSLAPSSRPGSAAGGPPPRRTHPSPPTPPRSTANHLPCLL